jgi:hypothetical protein
MSSSAMMQVNRSYQAGRSTPITFISGDRPLNAAATAEGLPVDDPNGHP